MNALRIIAVILILLGVFALVAGKITYGRETHKADLGPVEFAVKEKKSVDIPPWVGIVIIATGTVLLLVPRKK